jgi:hypothetical protein
VLSELDTKKIIRIHSLKKIILLSASIDKLEKILEDIMNGKKS